MIDSALTFIRQALDDFLSISFGLQQEMVVLNNLVDADGGVPERNRNCMVITLINLEYETNKQLYGGQKQAGAQFNQVNPAIRFNIDILVSASYDDYHEALKFLTATIGFFHEHQAFTRASNPTLPAGIPALTVEIENSSIANTHNLWNGLGANYMPSMIYKIRHVSVQSGQIKSSTTAINAVASSVAP